MSGKNKRTEPKEPNRQENHGTNKPTVAPSVANTKGGVQMASPLLSASSFASGNCRPTSFSNSQYTTCFFERSFAALNYKIYQQDTDPMKPE